MNTLIQERHNRSENCITVQVSRRTLKVEIYVTNGGSGLAVFSTDLGHIFKNNVGKEFGVMLRGKEPHKPKVFYDIVGRLSRMIYMDLIDYNIVDDRKAPLLSCFHFFWSSSLETLYLLDSTQTIRRLATGNLEQCSKFPFIVFTLTWETRAVKKYPLCLSISLVLFWCSEKPPTFFSNLKDVTRCLLQDK